jgi:hypothetical protein
MKRMFFTAWFDATCENLLEKRRVKFQVFKLLKVHAYKRIARSKRLIKVARTRYITNVFNRWREFVVQVKAQEELRS